MMPTAVLEKLTAVFRDVFDDDALLIVAATTASDIDDWDSLAHVNLVVAVEKAFGLSFTTKEISSLNNVGEFVNLIHRKMPPSRA
ncbi:MAG: acyl carrier protein [Myxococcales bacterium]|nr:acyl carrier protein [Myxococcales bacterium]